ncbi:iron-containing alcohol dehydrogenase [Aneurinibacillus sp. REN35]|uniref:iron-containing alcohol dehydrogenase n=1 Tax=Aneurinibacillus sp. REN35 TaxID=3237286 RepID=UPI003528BBF6
MADCLEFSLGTKLVLGPGCIEKIKEELESQGVQHLLVVTDQGIITSGIFDRIQKILHVGSFSYDVFDNVHPNPDVKQINQAFHSIKDTTYDSILAVGGGSVIDTAKALAVLKTNQGEILDYEGRGRFTIPALPLFVVPTTVGTGSEVTRACVISDHNRHRKTIVGGPSLAPRVSFLDAELVTKLPNKLVAATAIDALTHAIEGYVSKKSNLITDALNLYAIKTIASSIRQGVADRDIDSMNNLLVSSTVAGIGAGNCSLGLIHAISHAIGGYYNVSHGEINAILLPHVIKFNWDANPNKYAEIRQALGHREINMSVENQREELVKNLQCFLQEITLPIRLREIGVDHTKIDKLAAMTFEDHYYIASNPRTVELEDIKNILQLAM